MDELSLYDKILNLSPPWTVESMKLDESDSTVHVYVDFDRDVKIKRPLCEANCSRHDTKSRTWRHLVSCQFKTLVHAHIPRTKCSEHSVLQIDVPWAEDRSSFPLMFEAHVISWLHHASINAVGKKLGLSWNTVDCIMSRAVNRGLSARTRQNIKHLAVDEVCSKKGREYVTLTGHWFRLVIGVVIVGTPLC